MIFLFVIGVALWIVGRRIHRRSEVIVIMVQQIDEDVQALQRTLAQINDLPE